MSEKKMVNIPLLGVNNIYLLESKSFCLNRGNNCFREKLKFSQGFKKMCIV